MTARTHMMPRAPFTLHHLGLIGACSLLILGFSALRLALSDNGFWFDELASLIFADQPISRLWSGWMVRETNPPLFYTLLHLWQALGFTSTMELKLLPIIGSALGMALLAVAASIGWGKRAAIPAIVLAGLSAEYIVTGTELRGYIFAADAVVLASIGLLLMLFETRWRLGMALYVLGSALAIYFHTTMFLWPLIATIALLAVSGQNWRRTLIRMLVADTGIALLTSWWFWMTIQQLHGSNANISWIEPITFPVFLCSLSSQILLVQQMIDFDNYWAWLMALMFVGLLSITIRGPATRLFLALAITGCAIFWIAQSFQPILMAKTLFWLSSCTLLIMAGSIGQIPSSRLSAGFLLCIAALLGFNLIPKARWEKGQNFNWVVHLVASHPGAALLVEHEAMGATSAKACAVEFPGRPCPFPIITMQSTDPGSSPWVRGLGPKVVTVSDAARILSHTTAFYTVRHAKYDALVTLGMLREARRGVNDHPLIAGPFSTARFREKR